MKSRIKKLFSKMKLPFSFYEFSLAKRYLKGKANDKFFSVITWFSLIGIGLGVAVLIIVMSVMNGFKQEMLSSILGINGHIMIYNAESKPFEDYKSVMDKISKDEDLKEHITFAMPITEGQVMLASSGKSRGGIVRGVDGQDFVQYDLLAKNTYGTQFGDLKVNEVLIGDKLAYILGLKIGDELTITSANGNVTAFGMMPRIRSYRVAGVFSVGMYQYDSSFVFMKLPSSQVFLNMDGAVSHVEIFTNDPQETQIVKKKLEALLGDEYRILDWKDLNSSFFNAINVQKNVLFLILTLIILVAGFNVISGLVMLVKDKRKDIAILRTVGMSKQSVMKIFMIAGSYVGVVGTAVGTFLGLLFCRYIGEIQQLMDKITGTELFSAEVYFLSQLPAKVNYFEVFWIVVLALIISVLSSLYPARRASKLDVIEVLRDE